MVPLNTLTDGVPKVTEALINTLLALLALPRTRNIEALIRHSAHLSIAVPRCVGPVLYVRLIALILAR